MPLQPVKKSEETRTRILESALDLFREQGFEPTTMRQIATHANVATGAAYYYFESKEAIVMAFYQRAQLDIKPALDALLDASNSLESRLRGLIQFKLNYFLPNRKLLGALTAHTDPTHPLSPFSEDTRPIREQDLAAFERAIEDSKVKLPRNLQPYLPRLLWLYQMGLILFWVYDHSPDQQRTTILFDRTLKMILLTLKLAHLPIFRPIHRIAAELLETIYG